MRHLKHIITINLTALSHNLYNYVITSLIFLPTQPQKPQLCVHVIALVSSSYLCSDGTFNIVNTWGRLSVIPSCMTSKCYICTHLTPPASSSHLCGVGHLTFVLTWHNQSHLPTSCEVRNFAFALKGSHQLSSSNPWDVRHFNLVLISCHHLHLSYLCGINLPIHTYIIPALSSPHLRDSET